MEQPEFNELYTKFSTHEAQCEERWKTIFTRIEGVESRLDKMNLLILGGGATTIMFLLGILSTLAVNHW